MRLTQNIIIIMTSVPKMASAIDTRTSLAALHWAYEINYTMLSPKALLMKWKTSILDNSILMLKLIILYY